MAQSDCYGTAIPALIALQALTNLCLWREVSIVLAWFIRLLSIRDEQLVGVTAYAMVRDKLLELWMESEESRMNISVYHFIQQRTLLGRSTILNILSALRKGKYIDMEKGKLIFIRQLPKHY
ncbi:helix-turn-helix domain-containing protein [Hafnia alvei]|uniref:Winged helix-turn-helix DNA binding n=1 Tax=Hafnia alvei TaxID=569 RepID=A0A1C6Z6L3_HAFAL|nr:helix-turn-helix domain-containing protein [Hafnia alvei]NLS54159.1 hypothetical protein [Hafnia alvei]SCM54727.1 Winged helix-turn-helix DNA binding [Hafnia alvei]